jgi:SPP1 family phage portal protein
MIIYSANSVKGKDLLKAVSDKIDENVRIQKLQNYYSGKQDILLRYYADATKPNNKIVANYCKDIADFMTSYVVGQPIKYEGNKDILTILEYNDDSEVTMDTTLSMCVSGFGCELFWIDSDGTPRYSSLDPKECIFIMNNDLEGKLIQFLRIVYKGEGKGYDVFSYEHSHTTLFYVNDSVSTVEKIGKPEPNFFGDIPVVLYQNGKDMQGCFEQLIPMQDAINKVLSDNVNDFEGFVDAYLVIEGMIATTQKDIDDMKANRVMLTDKDSKAYWLTKTADSEHIKVVQDTLRDSILELGNTPDLKDLTGWSTGSDSMKFRLIKSEIQATIIERNLAKGIKRKIELLYNILGLTKGNMSYIETVPVFTRNFLMGDTETTKEDLQ